MNLGSTTLVHNKAVNLGSTTLVYNKAVNLGSTTLVHNKEYFLVRLFYHVYWETLYHRSTRIFWTNFPLFR